MEVRPVLTTIDGVPTTDGAGVRLTRILGTHQMLQFDPFLLLDEFKSDNADDYIRGFPPHPHRGFETVTYLLHGMFRHRDSKGNEGLLTSGSVQWMTAGRGIIHSEMPENHEGLVWGFQLWLNLPADMKMTEPRYQDIPSDLLPVVADDTTWVKIIAGEYNGQVSPAQLPYPVTYYDVHLTPDTTFRHPVQVDSNSFCYIYDGGGEIGPELDAQPGKAGKLVIFGEGDSILIKSDPVEGIRFLLLTAAPLNEPIVRGGPFVMNTKSELQQAFIDYQNGVLDA